MPPMLRPTPLTKAATMRTRCLRCFREPSSVQSVLWPFCCGYASVQRISSTLLKRRPFFNSKIALPAAASGLTSWCAFCSCWFSAVDPGLHGSIDELSFGPLIQTRREGM